MSPNRPTPDPTPDLSSRTARRLAVGLALAFAAIWLFLPYSRPSERVSYTQVKQAIAAGNVQRATVSPTQVTVDLRKPVNGNSTLSAVRVEDPSLLSDLQSHGAEVTGVANSSFWPFLWPLLIWGGLLWMLMRRPMGGLGQGSPLTFGRSKARVYVETGVPVRFGDVAGVDEAKQELSEVVEFLKTPEKFQQLGGKIPKGVLLVGPPGTGKTLLARAVAGEAGVPFFSISGSEFVEMFVGVGAARVRDLFREAQEKAPCIVFIDELDAIGKARALGPTMNDEREQTLNQLLVELDGFDRRGGIVLMAATNRPEILDPALLRAGRFDRHVTLDRPDRSGRRAVLQVHVRTVALGPDADLDAIAAMTPGMAGADLANVINEAALLAVRHGHDKVMQRDLEESVERIIAGLERHSRVLTPKERQRVAYHELGHALVGLALPSTGAVRRISILPRGVSSLGYTLQLPTEERYVMTQSELEDRLAVMLGGRAAERVVFGELSTGAQDDLEKASELGRAMVRRFGMGEALGPVTVSRGAVRPGELNPFASDEASVSAEVARKLDEELRELIEAQEARAQSILSERRELLAQAVQVLLERESLTGEELSALAARMARAPSEEVHALA